MPLHKYVALIRKEQESDYWVDIPDLPGCVSSGETKEGAIASFEAALDFHVEGMRQENLQLPKPRLLKDVLSDQKYPYVEAYIIEVDVS